MTLTNDLALIVSICTFLVAVLSLLYTVWIRLTPDEARTDKQTKKLVNRQLENRYSEFCADLKRNELVKLRLRCRKLGTNEEAIEVQKVLSEWAARQSGPLILTGEMGAGKSIALLEFCVASNKDQENFALLLDMRNLMLSSRPMFVILGLIEQLGLSKHFAMRSKKPVYLILDGLDECFDIRKSGRFTDLLDAVFELHRSNYRVVLGTRTSLLFYTLGGQTKYSPSVAIQLRSTRLETVELLPPHASLIGRVIPDADLSPLLLGLRTTVGTRLKTKKISTAELVKHYLHSHLAEIEPRLKLLKSVDMLEVMQEISARSYSSTLAKLDWSEVREIVLEVSQERVEGLSSAGLADELSCIEFLEVSKGAGVSLKHAVFQEQLCVPKLITATREGDVISPVALIGSRECLRARYVAQGTPHPGTPL